MSNLIRHYGQFWNPDAIDWGSVGAGNSGKLLGKHKVDAATIETDFWNAQGIYVLFNDFQAIYVGKAFSTRLGKRVRDHLTDRFIGRWDMFSWFSISNYRKTKNDLKDASKKTISPETIVNTLEAISILISDPRLNRKRESIPNAIEVFQPKSAAPKSIRHYFQEILIKLDQNGQAGQP